MSESGNPVEIRDHTWVSDSDFNGHQGFFSSAQQLVEKTILIFGS